MKRRIREDRLLRQYEVYCPTCHSLMVLKVNKYGRLFYACPCYPLCKETHGAHPNGKPMGIPATLATRKLRKIAHQKLELIWDYKILSERNRMYKWLEKYAPKPHIAQMNEEELKRLIYLIDNLLLYKFESPLG